MSHHHGSLFPSLSHPYFAFLARAGAWTITCTTVSFWLGFAYQKETFCRRMIDQDESYARAVPHEFPGYYTSFETAATILRMARVEMHKLIETDKKETNHNARLFLDEFYNLLNEVELSLRDTYESLVSGAKQRRFIVVVEGLDGSGKSTVVQGLAEKLGGVPCCTPSSRLTDVRYSFDRRGGPVARAFYMISNFVLQYEMDRDSDNSLFIIDRWFSSTCAYSLGWKNTTGGPESIDQLPAYLFQWPRYLVRPQLQLVLCVDHEIRRERVIRRRSEPGQGGSDVNPWDDRLLKDPGLGLRIMQAHRRNTGPHETIELSANESQEIVLTEAIRVVQKSLMRHMHPSQFFSTSPFAWLVWESSRLELCDGTGRRLHHAPWSIQLGVADDSRTTPSLRSVGVHSITHEDGVFFYTWGSNPGGAGTDARDKRVRLATALCSLGEYPQEQQWRMEGFIVSFTTAADRSVDLEPPSSLVAHVHACSEVNQQAIEVPGTHRSICPKDYSEQVENARSLYSKEETSGSALLVGHLLVPLRMEVLVGGPSSPGDGPRRYEWCRGPMKRDASDDSTENAVGGWSKAVSILPFSCPGTLVSPPSIEIRPVSLVLLGVHSVEKDSIGRKLSKILDWTFVSASDDTGASTSSNRVVSLLGEEALDVSSPFLGEVIQGSCGMFVYLSDQDFENGTELTCGPVVEKVQMSMQTLGCPLLVIGTNADDISRETVRFVRANQWRRATTTSSKP